MNAVEATASYEAWLRTQLGTVLDDDLELKHRRMAADAFSFLRATYYLWLGHVTRHAPADLVDAPAVTAVGDLHVENFGCWRNRAGATAWGVNDFDELASLPYTYDLLRLCGSGVIAARTDRLPLHEHDVVERIVDGYRSSLAAGGRPFAVAADGGWLARLVDRDAVDEGAFWRRLEALPPASAALAPDATALLRDLAPAAGWHPVLHRRTAGLGSLGHVRVAAIGSTGDGTAARELKELCPPAAVWLGLAAAPSPPLTAGPSWEPDPLLVRRGSWQGRRLAPDAVRLDLQDYHRGTERRLLGAMGFETANVHQRSATAAVVAVRRHAETLDAGRLHEAVDDLLARLEHDHRTWARAVA